MLAQKNTSQSKQNKEDQPKIINWKDLPINSQNNARPPNPNSPTYQTQTNAFPEYQYQRVEPTRDDQYRWSEQDLKLAAMRQEQQKQQVTHQMTIHGINQTYQFIQANPRALEIALLIAGSTGAVLWATHLTKSSIHSGKIIIATGFSGAALGFYLAPMIHNFFLYLDK